MTHPRRWLKNDSGEPYLTITAEHLSELGIEGSAREQIEGHNAVHWLNTYNTGQRVYLLLKPDAPRFPIKGATTFFTDPETDTDEELDKFLLKWSQRIEAAEGADPAKLRWLEGGLHHSVTPNFRFLRYAGVPRDLLFESIFRLTFRQQIYPRTKPIEVMSESRTHPLDRFRCDEKDTDEAVADYLWNFCRAHLRADSYAADRERDNVIMAAGRVLTDMQTTGQSRTRVTLRPDVIEAATALLPSSPESTSFCRVRRHRNGVSISFDEDFIDRVIDRIADQLRNLNDVEVTTDTDGLVPSPDSFVTITAALVIPAKAGIQGWGRLIHGKIKWTRY